MTLVRPEDWRPLGVEDIEPNAWEAVRATASVLVTAGAGAGKTEFLAQKATYLLQTGLCPAPKRILAISFKRDAARNLTSRVEKRCPPEQARRFDSYTFDAFAKGLLDRLRAAVPDPYRPPAEYRIVFPRKGDFEDFLDRREIRGLNAQQLERAIVRTRLPIEGDTGIDRIVAEYWREQLEEYDETLLSFAMINRLVDYLLRENSSIRRALQLTYPSVFLDEFQDTTGAQLQLLRTAFDGGDPVFTAVGDDKQRIMVWAGAMRDAFDRYQEAFEAQRMSLVSNWRSHDELVRIQHVIASRIDPMVEVVSARGEKSVTGDIAAIWDFFDREEEAAGIGAWIAHEVNLGRVEPHDVALLVRMKANEVEKEIGPELARHGLRLRNEAREVGGISIQDLLGEDLTEIVLPIFRLGAAGRSPQSWNATLRNLYYLEAVDPADEFKQQIVQARLQAFIRQLRRYMRAHAPGTETAEELAGRVLKFIGGDQLRQVFPAYQRRRDFDRAWTGFRGLLRECADRSERWFETIDEFAGLGQVPLMTVHKSKGLEFHTMIFLGLDNQSWWSLTPSKSEELNTFFVAFTRAEQRAFFTTCRARGQPVSWLENLLEPAGMERVDGRTLAKGL